jgi:hypothetical protein
MRHASPVIIRDMWGTELKVSGNYTFNYQTAFPRTFRVYGRVEVIKSVYDGCESPPPMWGTK